MLSCPVDLPKVAACGSCKSGTFGGSARCFLCRTKAQTMNTPRLFRSAGLLLMAALLMAAPACKERQEHHRRHQGEAAFTGGKYESDNRWFRGTGQAPA